MNKLCLWYPDFFPSPPDSVPKKVSFVQFHHSTSIEGASLTEKETQLLLDENLTAKGKPIVHHNMQSDLYRAVLLHDTIPDLLASRCPRITRIFTNSNSRYSEN